MIYWFITQWRRLVEKVKRGPDFVISEGYLDRWHLIPRNPVFNVYLHHFKGPDPHRDVHDHPWWNLTIVLSGHYMERPRDGQWKIVGKGWGQRLVLRKPRDAHNIGHVSPGGCWTLFITGPRMRKWGFWKTHPNGRIEWVPYDQYLAEHPRGS